MTTGDSDLLFLGVLQTLPLVKIGKLKAIAVASEQRRPLVSALGAADFIDYQAEAVERWPVGYDAVLDCVPNISRAVQRRLLARRGHYVTTVSHAATFLIDPFTNRFGGVQRHGVMLKPDAGVMNEVLGYVAQVRLRCTIEREFPLRRARDAIERSRSGRVQGKIVLVI